ncbi:MAG: hypothetical protein HXS54_09205 [Theionarchaea archaeon]|nr:hypothetical protein [Theionarchaea archaeon]
MMADTESENGDKIWKIFLRRHWKMLVLFVVGAVLAVIGAILVFLWFVGDAQFTNLIPATLGLWTMKHLVTFLLHLIFREVLFIGVPVILAIVIIIFLWWKKLPEEEREEYKRGHLFSGPRSRSTSGGNGISLLISIAFIIKVYLDGNWNNAIATWEFDYLVHTCLWALIWVLIIFGIPIGLGAIWWMYRKCS